MIYFECDYQEGAHPKILEKLQETNWVQTLGYGEDAYCQEAKKTIQKVCRAPFAEVHFLVGGTQTNTTVLTALLRPHQGVLSADTGHISVHETGAIEATGHKVLGLPSGDGKITAQQVEQAMEAHRGDVSFEHMVQPAAVYLSFPTENGTLYNKEELCGIRAVCDRYDLLLYVDGARLGYGLASEKCDLSLPELARLCDVFYIGGTKVGALFGEAVVFPNVSIARDFRYLIKQRGGMLAKGRLLGIQFQTLFQDDLYLAIAKHGVDLAMKFRKACESKGIQLLYDSWTNQQYPILSDDKLRELSKKYAFCYWQRMDAAHSAVRVCTSWATREEDLDALIADL